MALPFQKGLEKYKNIDEDELLGKLSEEELKQLENVLDDLDPEVCGTGVGCLMSTQEKGVGGCLLQQLPKSPQPQCSSVFFPIAAEPFLQVHSEPQGYYNEKRLVFLKKTSLLYMRKRVFHWEGTV